MTPMDMFLQWSHMFNFSTSWAEGITEFHSLNTEDKVDYYEALSISFYSEYLVQQQLSRSYLDHSSFPLL